MPVIYANQAKIRTFKDLYSWQEAHKLVLLIYKVTNKFPSKEDYALTSQMRRATVSVSSNIAEGFSRKSSREKSQFFSTALGSLTELQSQLLVARDVKYLSSEVYESLNLQSIGVHKLINGLIKSTKKLHPQP